MNKKPFVTKEQLDEITAKFPTPYHLYDEKGIRDNAKAVKEAFAWNKGYREYFAVKACPNLPDCLHIQIQPFFSPPSVSYLRHMKIIKQRHLAVQPAL